MERTNKIKEMREQRRKMRREAKTRRISEALNAWKASQTLAAGEQAVQISLLLPDGNRVISSFPPATSLAVRLSLSYYCLLDPFLIDALWICL